MPTDSLWGKSRSKIESGLSAARERRFEPATDTLVAVVALFGLWAVYYVQSGRESVAFILLFLVVGNLVLTILFPLYYVCVYRDEPLSEIGITTTGWKRAVVVSSIMAVIFAPGLLTLDLSTAVLIPHILTVGLMLWEPFFVHGFLQIRFEQAFGPLPGIVLAAVAFVLFHVGSVALVGLLALGLFGLLHAVFFRVFDRNLLVLWPIWWAVGSAQGTADAIVFGWEEASAYVVILLIAGIAIYAAARSRGSTSKGLDSC